MKYKTNLSPKVKELLSSIDWDYKKGTIKSEELIKNISSDKTLDLLIKAHNLENIKHDEISVEDLLKNAYKEAGDLESGIVETTHLLISILKTLGSKKYNKVKKQIKEVLGISQKLKEKIEDTNKKTKNNSKKASSKKEDKQLILEKIGVVKDLTDLARKTKLKNVVNRPDIEKKIISTISRKYKNSCLLVGPKGCGRTSLIISLVQRINTGNVPDYLKNASVVSVNLPVLLNSFEVRDKFEVGFKEFIEHKSKQNEFTIFFFDDLHLLSSIGMFGFSPPLTEQFIDLSSNSTNINSRDKQAFKNVAFIGTMNNDHSDRFFDSPIYEMWEVIDVQEPKSSDLKDIVKLKLEEFETFFSAKLSDESLDYIVSNLNKMKIESSRIEHSVNLLDNLFASFVSQYPTNFVSNQPNNSNQLKDRRVVVKAKGKDDQQVDAIAKNLMTRDVSEYNKLNSEFVNMTKTAIPHSFVTQFLEEDYEVASDSGRGLHFTKLKNLEKSISKDIIGQESAIKSLVNSIKRSSFGLTDSKKPLTGMLFLGPTGVGKTETAKSLSKNLYGKDKLVRIDMSDFMEKHTVARLVGAPPGYVGYSEGGQLTDFVSQNPTSVVLFDEIEKAHPDVLNILLQILEEGELTTGEGDTVDFNNTVVILTSNLGADLLQKNQIGFASSGFDVKNKEMEENLKENLKGNVKPEILNRLSDIVVFRMLNEKDASKIVKKELKKLQKNVYKKHKVKLKVTNSVTKYIVKKGYSQEYGARELKRSIERNLMDDVIEYLIKNPNTEELKASVSKSKLILD